MARARFAASEPGQPANSDGAKNYELFLQFLKRKDICPKTESQEKVDDAARQQA